MKEEYENGATIYFWNQGPSSRPGTSLDYLWRLKLKRITLMSDMAVKSPLTYLVQSRSIGHILGWCMLGWCNNGPREHSNEPASLGSEGQSLKHSLSILSVCKLSLHSILTKFRETLPEPSIYRRSLVHKLCSGVNLCDAL
jgi:hypothetical protein